ncbi:MAG: SDR family oxidoreductase [Flavobacteriales bacterium]
MELEGKQYIVTGGSSGIGKAIAKGLSDEGASVLITGRDEKKVEEVAQGIGAVPLQADVASSDDVERTYRAFRERFGRLDGLINNAGVGMRKALEELTPEDIRRIHDVNVTGAAMMAAHAVPFFKEQNGGDIVNIGSTAGMKGMPGGSVYVSSKFALRGMSYCWQHELRPHNVRVMLVQPSEVPTAFDQEGRKERPEEAKKLRPEEIAHAVLSNLRMEGRGFIPELEVIATNPW